MKAERHHPSLAFAPRRARNHDREFAPAPIGRRFGAMLLDSANLATVSGGILALHFAAVGALFPLWVVAAVVVAWNVLPLWVCGRTVGLRAFGLRMIRADGKPMDLLELAFRELIARGTVSMAILVVAAVVPVIEANGAQELPTPSGLWTVVMVVALINVAAALAGHCMALFRPDRRTAQDTLAKVVVVDANAHARTTLRVLSNTTSPTRAEPAEQWRQQESRRRVSAFIGFELVFVALGLGVPFLSRIEVEAFDVEARFEARRSAQRLEALRSSFEMDSADRWRASEYERELTDVGQVREARSVRARHGEALKQRAESEERALRRQLAQAPNWAALDRLVSLLSGEGRVNEARDVFRAYVEVETDPHGYQAFGIWLYRNQFNDEAVPMLERAIEAGADEGIAFASLGFALQRVGRLDAARAAHRRALRRDASLRESLSRSPRAQEH